GGENWDLVNSIYVNSDTELISTGSFDISSKSNNARLNESHGNSDAIVEKRTMASSVSSWLKQLGGVDNRLRSLSESGKKVIEKDGAIYLTGLFQKQIKFNENFINAHGKADVFISKMSAATGDIEWLRSLGGISQDEVSDMIVDESGNIYLAGTFQHTLFIEDQTISSENGKDVFCIKYNSDGILKWIKTFSGSDNVNTSTLKLFDDKLYLIGDFKSDIRVGTKTYETKGINDIYFISMTLLGDIESFMSYGIENATLKNASATIDNNELYFIGSIQGTNQA
ncbi:hypothetical protein, partial [Fulvivirga aurantia]|uniref:hypothetical protein n=1 Tax=Fulvivirga aurantia TaxID=2529383 RepID=UPI0016270FA0